MPADQLGTRHPAAVVPGALERLLGTDGSFRRSAMVLAGGTFAAQALPMLLYPVFTRLFAPAEFGVFATISTLATVLATFGSGAYEHAILIARTKHAAAHVAAYAMVRALVVITAVSLGLVLALPWGWPGLIGVEAEARGWLVIVPVMAATMVVHACFSEWSVRNRQFGGLSVFRVIQSGVTSAARLGFGLVVPAMNGFVAGDFVGKLVSAVSCFRGVLRRDAAYLHVHTRERLRGAARRFANVARYAMPDQLLNVLAGSVHVLLLGAAFGAEQLGYVSLVLSLMYAPVTVVSTAIKDVFRQRASVEYAKTGSCRATYRSLLPPVALLSALGFGTLYALAPAALPVLLGSEWAVAGEYTRILTPLFFTNFVSMSLGGVLLIAERADVSLVWQSINLALTAAALVLGARYFSDIAATLWCFTAARSAAYLLYMAVSYYYAQRPPSGPALAKA